MSQDGVQMGRVIDMNADGIVVEKGQFFLRDFQVPFSDISAVRGDELVLVRDHAALRQADTGSQPKDTVGIAGIAAPPSQGGLGLGPTDLTKARMDSSHFQDHGQYDPRTFREGGTPLPPDPLVEARMDSAKFQDHRLYDVGTADVPAREAERRAAGVDEEEKEKQAPRTGGPDTKPPTRY